MPLQGVIWVGQDQEPVSSYIPLCLRKKMCEAGMLSWVNIVEFRAFGILRRQKWCINCLASFQNSYNVTVSGGSYQWSTIMPKRMINNSVWQNVRSIQNVQVPVAFWFGYPHRWRNTFWNWCETILNGVWLVLPNFTFFLQQILVSNKDSVLNCFTKDQDLKTPSQPNKHQPIIAVLVKSFSSSDGLRNTFTDCLQSLAFQRNRPWFGFQFSASLLLLILAAWELQNLDMWEEKGVPVLEIAFTWLGYVLLSPL